MTPEEVGLRVPRRGRRDPPPTDGGPGKVRFPSTATETGAGVAQSQGPTDPGSGPGGPPSTVGGSGRVVLVIPVYEVGWELHVPVGDGWDTTTPSYTVQVSVSRRGGPIVPSTT